MNLFTHIDFINENRGLLEIFAGRSDERLIWKCFGPTPTKWRCTEKEEYYKWVLHVKLAVFSLHREYKKYTYL